MRMANFCDPIKFLTGHINLPTFLILKSLYISLFCSFLNAIPCKCPLIIKKLAKHPPTCFQGLNCGFYLITLVTGSNWSCFFKSQAYPVSCLVSLPFFFLGESNIFFFTWRMKYGCCHFTELFQVCGLWMLMSRDPSHLLYFSDATFPWL